MLQQVDENIWIVEGDCVDFYSFPYPTRSVIVRLKDGRLWVWSPVQLTEGLANEVGKLGPVAHLVSPNKIHYLFLEEWAAAFPDAKLWGPASTMRKCRGLKFEAPLTDTPPLDWADEIDQVRMSGSPAMDEVIFFHKASRTAILADLSENFSDAFLRKHWKPWAHWIAKRWKIVEGWGYAPLEWRLSFIFRKRARAAKARILTWPTRRVVMAHGEWQREEGHAYLKKALAWL